MLIKEYRIPLPLSVDEYRIAQLYMIQKKSRQESKGAGSGVEILINQPYEDGPGGTGQYTHKVYHIGSHLPGWFRAILPKTALRVEEESWNAYPYTKTRYTCPFIEKFSLEVETKYLPDAGHQDNVFNLSSAEAKSRYIDLIDFVNDPISSGDYVKEDDPRTFQSKKTGRGPLNDDWREVDELDEFLPKYGCTDVMCAYKLCRVEFRYWGMQNRIEKFIHDVALKKTMFLAHRQAWCWQDEWYGLCIDDIRELEREAAQELQERMAEAHMDEEIPVQNVLNRIDSMASRKRFEHSNGSATTASESESESRLDDGRLDSVGSDFGLEEAVFSSKESSAKSAAAKAKRRLSSRLSSESRGSRESNSHTLAHWHMDSIQQDSDSSDEEFFDAKDWQDDQEDDGPLLSHWSSEDVLSPVSLEDEAGGSQFAGNLQSDITVLFLVLHGGNVLDGMQETGAKSSDINTFKTAFDAVVRAHFPVAQGHIAVKLVSCPPTCHEAVNLITSLGPCGVDATSSAFDNKLQTNTDFVPIGALSIMATSNPDYLESVTATVGRMNAAYHEFVKSQEGHGFQGQVCVVGDCMGAILGYDALARGTFITPQQYLSPSISTMSNCTFYDAPISPPGSSTPPSGSPTPNSISPATPPGNTNQLSPTPLQSSIITHKCPSNSTIEMLRSTDAFDGGPRKPTATSSNNLQAMHDSGTRYTAPSHERVKRFSNPIAFSNRDSVQSYSSDIGPDGRRISLCSQVSMTSDMMLPKVEFEVTHFFMFGSPLGLVLAYRRSLQDFRPTLPLKPACSQLYNLFHRTDPSAARLEPLLHSKFSVVTPFSVERYQKYPRGDGRSSGLIDAITTNMLLFSEGRAEGYGRRHPSVASSASEAGETEGVLSGPALHTVNAITSKWWGSKRLDFALYCPEALQAFPTGALPHLFHASYWESTDTIAFILRQVFHNDSVSVHAGDGTAVANFIPAQPREKWQRKRTSVKMKQSVNPNHRAKDVVVVEGSPQMLVGRFMYSTLDMVTLTGEKVDIHIMTQPPSGEWVHFATEVTSSNGRVSYTIPEARRLGQGIYPVKMVVRGDHTSADSYLTVVPPKTECVVFSIDGSFTASVSIMGRDPKVRAGAVDVVRHWQELNYLIIYVTARPSMQKQKVVSWLAQHNFPHGVVSFCDGITTDPLRQKANYLKGLVDQSKLVIHAAYGSSKDIPIYSSIGLKPTQIFIVGKVSKKYQSQAVVLSDGYAAHLDGVSRCSRPAVGNARLALRKGCFSLPGQSKPVRPAKQPATRTASYHGMSPSGPTGIGSGSGGSGTTRTLSRATQGSVKFEV
ncbi:protein retinal degeneration B-like [Lytechinus variegatus]|uniref:protein retinal degeneration B-like n=1 Tax=Lytechinus variegatus TaxID=7654 RepID=UPI001BB2651F|nr:protein retinal degeneration B-like [Lytechinus variegatus]XP_041457037.1 protein retinal degeneration B-like [Lytechinus variegatus]XP_041457038.1 protein retinal degeneration B-like [Lytechinus variegatus]